MGKHEREKVEKAEKDVCARINGKGGNADHDLADEAKSLAERLIQDFEIERCEHVGNEYGTSRGDLVLHIENGNKKYVEVKFLRGGTGTLANIGQDSLTEYGLFEDNPLHWSDFRQKEGFDDWRRKKLNEFNYPKEIESETADKKDLYKKGRHLKEVLDVGRGEEAKKVAERKLSQNPSSDEEQAARIVKEICERANEGKEKYINYLMDFDQNENAIKKFTLLMFCGAHSKTKIEEKWPLSLDEIINDASEEYEVYYVYKENCDVEREDQHLRRISDGDIHLTPGKNNIFVSLNDETTHKVLKMTYHWGRKFQGIQNPRINVFDMGFLN